ncbi:MAG: proprotein convertase P-domain-containing protein [Phycisphaerales bacterium]|nr:proprotein convertase P-domain-containing protein [Phycisphaerales bacterium]
MRKLLGLSLLCLGTATALAVDFPETEDNNTKGAANAVTLAAGDSVSGTTTGNSTTVAGLGSADYFRVTTSGFAGGTIHRHRMRLTAGDTTGHALTIRGLTQTGGSINAGTDAALQSSSTATTPPRFVQWYGFGAAEQVYVRMTGSTATTGQYVATLESSTVTPIDVGSRLEGPITIARGSGNTTPVDFWLYDGSLNAIVDAGNAGNNTLSRNLTAGTYYVAFSNVNTANNLASPADDSNRAGNVMDFPNGAVNSTTTTVANMNIAITDVSGTIEGAGAKSGPYDIVWYRFTVIAADVACCFSDGSCQFLGVSACLTAGGTPQALGSNCSPNPCPQPGACCLAAGGCALLLESACTASGGQFQGQSTSCPSSCEAAQACCLPNTSCIDAAPFSCAAQNGTARGPGSSCTPALCIPPGGDCESPEVIGGLPFDTNFNNSTNSSDFPPGSCNAVGAPTMDNSYWLRWDAEEDCEVLVQATGTYDIIVAVHDGACGALNEVRCIDDTVGGLEQGTFQATSGTTYWIQVGDWGTADFGGATAFHMECVAQGACCLPDGTCQDISSLACQTAFGVFQGDGSECATTACPPAEGCCFANQTCQFLTTDRCSTLGGTSLGAGTDCNVTCVRGACCNGVVCSRQFEQICIGGGGFYQGDTTSCDSVAGTPTTYSSSPNLPILDSPAPAQTDTINVADTYAIGDVNVRVQLTHSFLGDLDMFLSHNATNVTLWSRDCGGNNDMDVTFDDEGSALVCGQPTTGTFTPTSITAGQTLDVYDGQSVNGDWTLSIEDQAGADTGVLTLWELIIDQQGVGVCFPDEPLACCFADGSCQFLTPTDCQTAGGRVLGLGTNCSPNVCPQPEACCLPDGTCQTVLVTTCSGLSGQPAGAGTNCTNFTCPAAQGCCIGTAGNCSDLVPAACAQQNGVAQGAGTSCGGNVCDRGACCIGTECTINYAGSCALAGGTFVGANTNCGAVAGTPTTYTSNPNSIIADNQTITDTINITDTYTVGDVRVGIIIQHTFQGDIIAHLTGPNLVNVLLINRPNNPETTFGFGTDNYGDPLSTTYFILDDDATLRYDVPDVAAGFNNPTGNWLPDNGVLADLDGQPVTGDWVLTVSDNAGGDTGFLVSWQLLIDQPGPGPCTGPSCLVGDANCDGVVNNFDIDPFVVGIVNGDEPTAPSGYSGDQACWDDRECWGDVNRDEAFNNFDIDPFVNCIVALPPDGEPCPAP